MIQKKLSTILFFMSFAEIIRAVICVSYATVISDETDAQNPILAHNLQIPISSSERTIDYLTAPAGTSLIEIPHQISQARQSKGLSPYIPLNQQDELLNYTWYVNNNLCEECPMPGKIIKIYSQKGQNVTPGQELCKIESMKMEHTIKSTIDGEIIDILVQDGDQVGIQPILKLRPLKWKSINFQDILDNQKILSTFFPWESSRVNVPPAEDLTTILSENTEKQAEPYEPVSIPEITDAESVVVIIDQSIKPSLPFNSIEESLVPIISKNNNFPSKDLKISKQLTLLPFVSKLQPEMDSAFPEKMVPLSTTAEKQIALSPLISVAHATKTKSIILTKVELFKASLLRDRIKKKTYSVQNKNFTARKYYKDWFRNFPPQKLNLPNFMTFKKIPKNLYLLITLYCFALFIARVKRREISLQTKQPKKFIQMFHKQALNQNFSSVRHIKLA